MKKLIAVFALFCFACLSLAQEDSVYTIPYKDVRPATIKDSTIWIIPLDTLIWVGRNKQLKVWIRNQGWASRYLRVFEMTNVNGSMVMDSVLMEVIARPVTVKWHK